MENYFCRYMFSKKGAGPNRGASRGGKGTVGGSMAGSMTTCGPSVFGLPLHCPGGFKDKIDNGALGLI